MSQFKEKNDSGIENKYGINPNRLTETKGSLFLTLDRQDYKLDSATLSAFAKFNNFSKEIEIESSPDKNKKHGKK
jgi:hypothetical protein